MANAEPGAPPLDRGAGSFRAGDASREQRAECSSANAAGQGSIPVRMRSTRSWQRFRVATQSGPERSGRRHSLAALHHVCGFESAHRPVCGFQVPAGVRF